MGSFWDIFNTDEESEDYQYTKQEEKERYQNPPFFTDCIRWYTWRNRKDDDE